ncbi:hypothetical protein BC830DRAFT_1119037 [Chytriomyces sp. MP71]|nr:hypothetical protein BC830DRAFT_1119037 [Chytriomyces sp. MP71]
MLSRLLEDALASKSRIESQLNATIILNKTLEERIEHLEHAQHSRVLTPEPHSTDNEVISAMGIELHDRREAEERLVQRVKELEESSRATEGAREVDRAADHAKLAQERKQWESERMLWEKQRAELEQERAEAVSKLRALEDRQRETATPTDSHVSDLEEKLTARSVELDALTSELRNLRLNHDLIATERASFLDEVKQKSERVGTLEAVVEDLQRNLDASWQDANSKRLALEVERQTLQADRDALAARVRDLESAPALTTPSLSGADAAALQTQLASLQQENTSLQREIESLKWDQEWPTLESSSPKNTKSPQFPAGSASEMQALREEVAQLTRERDVLSGEVEKERKRAYSLDEALAGLKTQVDLLSAAGVADLAALAAARAEVVELRTYLKRAEEDNAELREQVEELEESVVSSPSKQRTPKPQPGSMSPNVELLRLKDDLAAMHGRYEEEARQFAERRVKLEQEIGELKKYLKAAEEDNSELREQVETLEETLSRGASPVVIPDVARLEREVADLTRQLRLSQDENSDLQSQIEVTLGAANDTGVGADVARLEEEMVQLKRYLKAAEGDNAELREKVEALEADPPSSMRSGLEAEVQQLRQYLKFAEEETATLREQINSEAASRLEREVENLKGYLKAAEEENQFLKDQIETLEQTTTPTASSAPLAVATPKNVNEDWDSWDEDPLDGAVPGNDSQHRIRELEAELDASQVAKINALEKLTAALEDQKLLSVQLAALEEQMDSADTAKIDALEQLTRALQERERLTEEMRVIHVERDSLEQKVAIVSRDVVALRDEVVTAVKARDNALASSAVEGGHKDEEVSKRLSELQATLRDAETARDAAVDEARSANEELVRSRENELRLAEVEERLQFVQYDYETLGQKHDSLIQEHAALFELKNRSTADSRDMVATLQQEKAEMTYQLASLHESGALTLQELNKARVDYDALLAEHENLLARLEGSQSSQTHFVEQERELERLRVAHDELVRVHELVKAELAAAQASNEKMREVGTEVMEIKSTLELDNADLVDQLEQLREAGSQIVEDRGRLEQECDVLAEQVDELNAQLAPLTEEKYALEAQMEAVRAELESKQHLYQEVSSRADRFEKLYREVEEKASRDANELVDTLRNLTEENSDMKTKLREQQEVLENVKHDSLGLAKLNSELRARGDSYEQELVAKALEMEGAQTRIMELEIRLQSLSVDLESSKSQAVELETQRQSLQLLQSENSDLLTQLTDAEARSTSTLEALRQIEAERGHLLSQLSETQARSAPSEEVEQLRAQLEESEARYDQLFTDGEAHTVDLEGRLNDAVHEIERLENLRSQLHYEIDFLKERLIAEEEFSAAEHAGKQNLSGEVVQLRQTCEDLEEQVRNLENSLLANEEVLQRVTGQLSSTEERMLNLTEELEAARQQNSNLETEHVRLQTQLNEHAMEQSGNSEIMEQVAQIQQKLATTESDRSQAVEQCGFLQQLLDETQSRLNFTEQQLGLSSQELDSLQSRQDAFQQDIDYYQQQISELQSVIANAEQARDSAIAERNDALNELNSVNVLSGSKETELNELQNRLEDEIAVLKLKLHEIEDHHDADTKARLEQLSSSLSQQISEKEQEVQQLHDQVGRLAREAEDASRRADEALEEMRVAEERASNAENALQSAEAEISVATAERDDIQRKFLEGAKMLDTLKARLESTEGEMNGLLSEKDSMILSVQASLDDAYRLSSERESFFEIEKANLHSRCLELESHWRNVQSELETVVSRYTETQTALESTTFQVRETEVKLEASEQERLMFATERDSLERQLADLHDLEISQRAELEELHLRIAQADERVKTLEQLVDSLELQRAQFNSVINNETTLMQDISHKQGIIEVLERELLQLKCSPIVNHVTPSSFQTADSLFGQTSNTGLTIEHELSLLKLEVHNKGEELASVHTSYKQVVAVLEEKLNNFMKLNKTSVQSMELYRDELLKKSERLEAVEEELFKAKAGVQTFSETPETSMVDISKYEDAINRADKTSRTLDALLQSATSKSSNSASGLTGVDKAQILDVLTKQISTLIRTTESNASISQRILNEVSASARVGVNKGVHGADDGQMKLIVQSQSSILDEHKRLLNDVELLSRLFREGGSPKRHVLPSWEEPSADIVGLVTTFLEKIEEYQKAVSLLALTKQSVLDDIMNNHSSKSILSSLNMLISGLEDVESQNSMLRKEISYLASIVNKFGPLGVMNAVPAAEASSVQKLAALKKPDSGAQDYRLSSREYSDLVTRASQSDMYQQQVENSQTLLAEHVREIQVLKEAMEAMGSKLGKEHKNSTVTDIQTFRLMTRQIDELKKVWSHELSANMILRNLIAKTQAENMVAGEEARKQQITLREEFDELVSVFEESQREMDLIRAENERKDQLLRNAEVQIEEKFNNRFFELEQQHIEQNQQLEDMYGKERTALNKLVSNLEKERNRLLTEVDGFKPQLKDLETLRQENNSLKSASRSGYDSSRREQELLADLQNLERQLIDERMHNERRLLDREAEWQRSLDEERRRRSGTDYSNERMDDALRVFRSQKEHLEHTLLLRDNQIHTLEVRIQELLQENDISQLSPRRGGSRREADLERDLQASFNQIRDLKSQLNVIDQARKDVETQVAVEKDRSKRLAQKVDDLKRRYIHQQRLLEDQDDAINTAIRPTPRGGGSVEEHLRDEISYLHQELHSAKQSRNDIIGVIRETLANTLGDVSIDAATASSVTIGRQQPRVDMVRLRTQMSSLIAEVIYLRALANRLFLWRADLKYQKVYLALRVEDLTASQKVTLNFIRDMGVDAPQNEVDGPILRPIQKFKAGVNVVIGVYRMMVMAREWKDTLQENNRDYFAPITPGALTDGEYYEEDTGMLTDASVRSTGAIIRPPPNQQYGSSNSMARTSSSSIRDMQSIPQTSDAYGRANRYGTIDVDARYASDASDVSLSRTHEVDRRPSGRNLQQSRLPYGAARSNGGDPRWISPGAGPVKNTPQPTRSLRRRD